MPKAGWSLQDGFFNKSPEMYPHRASGSGENGGLQFEMWRAIAEVKNSPSFNKGFKLVAHLPSELPQFDKIYYRFPLEKMATLIIRPSMIVTENLDNYNYKTRQCYFEGEKKLKLFRNYTRSNCNYNLVLKNYPNNCKLLFYSLSGQLECLAEFTRRQCKCIHFSMPRLKGDTACDHSSFQCVEDAKKKLMQINMEESLSTSKKYDDQGEMACGCLPACTSLQYEGEISHDDFRYFGKYKNNE